MPWETIALNPLVRAAAQRLERRRDAASIDFDDNVAVQNARKWLRRPGGPSVLANLLDNAVKFSPPDALITVHVAPRGRTCVRRRGGRGTGHRRGGFSHLFERFTGKQAPAERERPASAWAGCRKPSCTHIRRQHRGAQPAARRRAVPHALPPQAEATPAPSAPPLRPGARAVDEAHQHGALHGLAQHRGDQAHHLLSFVPAAQLLRRRQARALEFGQQQARDVVRLRRRAGDGQAVGGHDRARRANQ